MQSLNVKCRPSDVQRILGNVFLLFSSSFMFYVRKWVNYFISRFLNTRSKIGYDFLMAE